IAKPERAERCDRNAHAIGCGGCEHLFSRPPFSGKLRCFERRLFDERAKDAERCGSALEIDPRTMWRANARALDSENVIGGEEHIDSSFEKRARKPRMIAANIGDALERTLCDGNVGQCEMSRVHVEHAVPRRGFIARCLKRKRERFTRSGGIS